MIKHISYYLGNLRIKIIGTCYPIIVELFYKLGPLVFVDYQTFVGTSISGI